MAEFSDAKSGAYCTCTRERCSDECRTYRQFRPKPVTNADRVRNMDDYDLAIFLENVSCKHADTESWLDWLRQEAQT